MTMVDPIETLFSALGVAYGKRFAAQWSGQRETEVKAHWAATLHGIPARRIAWALRHLPASFPPTAMEFAALCREAPRTRQEAPKDDQAATTPPPPQFKRLAGVIAGLGKPSRHPLDWAERLKAREARGEHLSPAQRMAWRNALSDQRLSDGEQSEDE